MKWNNATGLPVINPTYVLVKYTVIWECAHCNERNMTFLDTLCNVKLECEHCNDYTIVVAKGDFEDE